MLMFAKGSNKKYKSNEILMFASGKHFAKYNCILRHFLYKQKKNTSKKQIPIQIVDVCQRQPTQIVRQQLVVIFHLRRATWCKTTQQHKFQIGISSFFVCINATYCKRTQKHKFQITFLPFSICVNAIDLA